MIEVAPRLIRPGPDDHIRARKYPKSVEKRLVKLLKMDGWSHEGEGAALTLDFKPKMKGRKPRCHEVLL